MIFIVIILRIISVFHRFISLFLLNYLFCYFFARFVRLRSSWLCTLGRFKESFNFFISPLNKFPHGRLRINFIKHHSRIKGIKLQNCFIMLLVLLKSRHNRFWFRRLPKVQFSLFALLFDLYLLFPSIIILFNQLWLVLDCIHYSLSIFLTLFELIFFFTISNQYYNLAIPCSSSSSKSLDHPDRWSKTVITDD